MPSPPYHYSTTVSVFILLAHRNHLKASPSGTGPDAVKTGASTPARTDPIDE